MYTLATIVLETDSIIHFAGLLTAIVTIGSLALAVYKWFQRQGKQDEDIDHLRQEIKTIKEEQCILTYGLLACLKGMNEHGYNGPVTDAIERIEKHLNQKAHEQ